ncbi:MAG: hypothetical protein AAF639_41330 [Chloroflexota bacterium]
MVEVFVRVLQADVLPDGATYVADRATANGVFQQGRLMWQIGTLAADESITLHYQVVPSQVLVSNVYRVQSATETGVIA